MADKKLKKGTAKQSGKDTVVVNLDGVGGARRSRAPEGQYKLVVDAASNEKGKSSGNPYVRWIFKVESENPKANGVTVYHNTVLTPEAIWSFRNVIEALGVKVKKGTMNVPLKKLVGRAIGAELVDGEPYDGKIRSEINEVFHVSLLDEEEPEDSVDSTDSADSVDSPDSVDSEDEEDFDLDLDDEDL